MSKINKQTLRQLLQANLLASIIHDLNNPLGSISLIVELQQEYVDIGKVDANAFNKQYEQIIKSIESGSKIARDFQNFSGEAEEEKEFFNLAENFKQFDSFSASYFRKMGSSLELDLQDTMAFANEADCNLFLFFLLFSLAAHPYEDSKISIKLEASTLKVQKPSADFSFKDIYSNNLAIEEADTERIIQELIQENGFEIQDETSTFLITFKTSET